MSQRRLLPFVLGLALVPTIAPGCGGSGGGDSGPTGPAASAGPSIGPCDSTTCSNNLAGLFVTAYATNKNTAGPDPVFTFTFAGLTLTTTGRKTIQVVGLTPGEHELSAQMITDRLELSFSASGGLRPVSVQLLDSPVGPVLTRACSALDWTTAFGTALSLPQRVRFRVTLVGNVVGQPSGPPTCLN